MRSIKSLGFTRACAAASKLCSLKERNFPIAQTIPDSQQNGSPPAKNGSPELLNFPALKRGATPPHSLSLWVLLLVNPVFWHASLDGPLRPHLALFSLLNPLPAAVNDPNRTPSIKNAILFGSFEASIGRVRYLDETTRSTLREIQNFAPKDRPSLIITTDAYVDQWFMNWRIGRYYLPEQDFSIDGVKSYRSCEPWISMTFD